MPVPPDDEQPFLQLTRGLRFLGAILAFYRCFQGASVQFKDLHLHSLVSPLPAVGQNDDRAAVIRSRKARLDKPLTMPHWKDYRHSTLNLVPNQPIFLFLPCSPPTRRAAACAL